MFILGVGPPETPRNLSITSPTAFSVRLRWIHGPYGGYEQKFIVKYSSNKVNWKEVSVDGLEDQHNKATVNNTGLNSKTQYEFHISATNQEGFSSPAVVSIVTKGININGNNLSSSLKYVLLDQIFLYLSKRKQILAWVHV